MGLGWMLNGEIPVKCAVGTQSELQHMLDIISIASAGCDAH